MKKLEKLKEIEILKDATILTTTGEKEYFDAIYLNTTGIFFGKINSLEEFVEIGFIPKHNVIKILSGEKTYTLRKTY
jgi:hypothetical protein